MATYVFFRSNTVVIPHAVKLNGVVENLAGAALLFTAKRKLTDTYASAIIKKTSAVGGGITITNAAGGLAQTQILPADTAALCANGKREKLFYDLELQTASGDTRTVEYGELYIDPDVTDTSQPVGPPAAPPDPIAAGTFLQHNGTSQIWSAWVLPLTAPVSNIASATDDITTTSTSDVVATNMTLTPPAGTYLVWFQSSGHVDLGSAFVAGSIYAGGVQVVASERKCTQPGTGGQQMAFACMARVTVNGTQAIEGRWRVSAGTGTMHQRQLMVSQVL